MKVTFDAETDLKKFDTTTAQLIKEDCIHSTDAMDAEQKTL
jgi:hypothetical protein